MHMNIYLFTLLYWADSTAAWYVPWKKNLQKLASI